MYKSHIEINKSNLLHNFQILKKNNCQNYAVVKANAYGHGLKEAVKILDKFVDGFAVDSLVEGLSVREMSDNKILVMGYIATDFISYAIENDISFVVYNLVTLNKIVELNSSKIANIHLKVETGLNRQGTKNKELLELAKFALDNQNLINIEGASMHFANVEDTNDFSFAEEQLAEFYKQLQILKGVRIKPQLIHSSSTAASMVFSQARFNMIRLGIGIYGIWPSKETKTTYLKSSRVSLRPALEWKSVIAQIKTIRVGESVGYGRTWFAARDSVIGIVPVGYFDGYDRKLSNLGVVIVEGNYVPVIGRVSMNMIMIDLTDIKNVKLESEVIIIGKQGHKTISADDIANKIGTISYEIVSRLNNTIPRIIV